MTASVRRIAFILVVIYRLCRNCFHKEDPNLSQRLTLMFAPQPRYVAHTRRIVLSIERHVSLQWTKHPCFICYSHQPVKQGHSQIEDTLYESVLMMLMVVVDGFVCVLASQQRGTLSRIQNEKAAEKTRVWLICTFNCENQNKNTNTQTQTQTRTNLVQFFAIAPDCCFTHTQSTTNTNTASLSEGFITSIRLWP